MADIQEGGGAHKGGKKRAKKQSTRIDMTPMVDLAFLLLTFFVLTSTFAKPKTLEINYPADPKKDEDRIKVTNALTFILTEKIKTERSKRIIITENFLLKEWKTKMGSQ